MCVVWLMGAAPMWVIFQHPFIRELVHDIVCIMDLNIASIQNRGLALPFTFLHQIQRSPCACDVHRGQTETSRVNPIFPLSTHGDLQDRIYPRCTLECLTREVRRQVIECFSHHWVFLCHGGHHQQILFDVIFTWCWRTLESLLFLPRTLYCVSNHLDWWYFSFLKHNQKYTLLCRMLCYCI